MKVTRRDFVKTGAAMAAAAVAAPRMRGVALSGEKTITPKLAAFGYGDVELLDGPLRQQFDTNHAFYAALDNDALLKPYRLRAGLKAPGADMGGWYDCTDDLDMKSSVGFATGHSFGQYLSGLARDYAATGNKATQEKVHLLVEGYAQAVSEKFYVNNRFPAYTSDKVTIGLIDAHEFAGCPVAFKALDLTMDAVDGHLPEKALSRDEQYARPHRNDSFCWDETYTLPENLFLAYKRGAGQRYLDKARKFLADDFYFGPLSEGKNVLGGKHAYSHVNALNSAMMAYFELGSEKHLRAAINGFDFLRAQSFATGGWGPDETLRAPGSGEVGESLHKTHSSFETPCGAYGHFKITRNLLRATGDSRYGDSMERVLYNTILGVKPIQKDGSNFYYSDYNENGSKFYHGDKWTCCSGTFAQITADYGISAYFHDGAAVYVNLFVPSRVSCKLGGQQIQLTQQTRYPHVPTTSIEISATAPAHFPLHVRIPAWAGAKTTIAVNGRTVLTGPEPGRFVRIDRTWKRGDRVEIEFEMQTTLEAVDPEHPTLMAPVHGPLALFSVGAIPASIAKIDLLSIRQVASGSTDWQTTSADSKLILRPFASIGDEHYRLYLKVEG